MCASLSTLDRPILHAANSPLVPLLDSLQRVAESRANVLVAGESGVGKEGFVRALHQLAPWSSGPFVPINCGAIPENLLESELFGHVRGAFTGADRARVGRLEAANGGTLFLDEIGEMPLGLQVKLLRVLQEHEFVPVGATTAREATFRLIAATNRGLDDATRDGSFREDLYFRLVVVRLEIPPLRERRMDVAPLARHFLDAYARRQRSDVRGFTPGALTLLERYDWPGNVRELENVVQGALVFKADGLVTEEDVLARLRGRVRVDEVSSAPGAHAMLLPDDGVDLRRTLEDVERSLIRQALWRSEGNRARAAGLLGLNRTTLVEKLKRHPLEVDSASTG